MGGYQIPFSFKAEGLSELDKVRSIIEQVGKSSTFTESSLRKVDAILIGTATSGGNLTRKLNELAKGGLEVTKEMSEIAKAVRNVNNESINAQQAIDKMGRTMDAAIKEGAQRAKKALDEANQSSSNFASNLLRFGTSAGVVDSQLAGMTRGVGGFAGGLGALLNPVTIAAAAVVGFATAGTSLVREYAAASRETERFAERLGLSLGKARQLEQVGAIAGVNVRSLEQAARLLGTALDDSTGAGKKAADALHRLGVETVTVNGESRDMGVVLLEGIQKLSGIKDAAERAHIANQIFAKGSKEIQPLIQEYEQLRKTLRDMGVEYDENMLKKAADGDKAFRQLGLAWQYFKDKLAQSIAPIIIPIIFKLPNAVVAVNDAVNPANVGTRLGLAARAEIDRVKEQIQHSITGFQVPGATPGPPTGMFTPDAAGAKGFGARQANTEEGLKAQIKAIETANAKLAERAGSDTIPAENRRRAQAEFDANKSKIDALQAQIDKTKELAKLQEQLPEMRKALARERLEFKGEDSTTARTALQGIFAVRDAPTADLKAGNAELATERLQKAAKQEFDKFLKENAKVLKEETPKSLGLADIKGQDKQLTAQIAADKRTLAAIDAAETARINDQSGALRSKADQQARIVALMAGPGGELQALRIGLQLRMEAAAAELALKQRHSDLFDVEKARIDYEKEAERANYDFQLDSLEKVKREKDAFKQDTVRFFGDLVSGNGSGAFKSIGKNLMDQVVGNAAGLGFDSFKKTITSATHGIDTEHGMGRLLSGTMFDNKASSSVPVKIDTSNQLLGRIVANTTPRGAVAPGSVGGVSIPQVGGAIGDVPGLLNSTSGISFSDLIGKSSAMPGIAADGILAGILGDSIGSSLPKLGGKTSGLAGLASGFGYTGDLGAIFKGSVSTPGGGTQQLSGAQRVGGAIGTAGVVTAGTFEAYDGFKRGGAKGNLQGIAATTGTAAALDPEPISKAVLGGIALAAGIIGSIVGDPKANRQHAIDKELGNARYFAPVSLHANMDTSGNYTDYGQDGTIRQSPFRGIPEVTQPYQWYKNGQYQQFPGRTLSPFQDPNVPLPGQIPGLPNPTQGGPTWRQGPNGVTNYNLTIQALDAKDIKDRAGDIADAMHHAIQSGRAQGFMEAHREASSR